MGSNSPITIDLGGMKYEGGDVCSPLQTKGPKAIRVIRWVPKRAPGPMGAHELKATEPMTGFWKNGHTKWEQNEGYDSPRTDCQGIHSKRNASRMCGPFFLFFIYFLFFSSFLYITVNTGTETKWKQENGYNSNRIQENGDNSNRKQQITITAINFTHVMFK